MSDAKVTDNMHVLIIELFLCHRLQWNLSLLSMTSQC